MFAYYLDLGWHSLKRNPVLTALMMLAIGLGIGASMTMITVLHVLTDDPLPARSAQLFTPHLDPLPLNYKQHYRLARGRRGNLVPTAIGVVQGMLLVFGINLYLMRRRRMDRTPWYYLPGSVIALWLLGQFSVFSHALRATAGPPVVATRSV